jgi:uncharacterized protein YjbJ (UPF0337 family)
MTWMNKLKNMAQISHGKAEEAAGNVTGDQTLQAEGTRDQQMGSIKQAGEKMRDAFKRR